MESKLDIEFVQEIYDIVGREDDFFGRSVTITPYRSSGYGNVGAVITVDGTPPKVTIYVPFYKDIIICLFGAEPIILEKYKVSTENQYETIMRYLKAKGTIK
jgi:hypothetical protein